MAAIQDGCTAAGHETESLPPITPGSPGAASADAASLALAPLTEALYAYLAELEAYRTRCAQHAATAIIRSGNDGVCVCRRYPRAESAIARLHANLQRLPGWETTPFWDAEQNRWNAFLQKSPGPEGGKGVPLALRGVGWKGRAVLVCAVADDIRLTVDVVLPPCHPDLPELPLRAVALALECHEVLLPPQLATPLPATQRAGGDETIWEYLRRATPQNLYAVQCIPGAGAEQSAPRSISQPFPLAPDGSP